MCDQSLLSSEMDAAEDRRQERIRVITARAAEMGRPRTQGEANLRRLLQDPVVEDDHDANIEIDTECLQWRSTDPTPSRLGTSQPTHECFGCLKNINNAVVNDDRLVKLVEIWMSNRGYCSDDALANEVYVYFVKYIQEPANRLTNDPSSKIPDWTPPTILEHFTSHVITAETFLLNNIRNLTNLSNFLYKKALYKENIHEPENVRAQEKAFKMLTDTIKLTNALYATDPSKMLLGGGQRLAKKNYIRPKDVSTSMSKPIESFFSSMKKN